MMRRSQLSAGRLRSGLLVWLPIALLHVLAPSASGEVILQYFNTSYRELAYKMPELAEVGYGALWLPPPTKGSGGLSVGYDLWDPFDLGGKNQRSTVRTRYGTEAELLHLIRVAHRFGIRVYFDNIMNHRAFDVPGYSEYTPIDIYPGMLPEDFHLRVTEEGFYRKWDNIANWSDTWQIQNRNFSDLIDIAQELPDNGNFGTNEGDHIPKIAFVRHPDNPEYYDHNPTNGWVGFGHPSITKQVIADYPDYYKEDVNAYLIRAVRWLVHHTKVDGLRLDAVKHVPDYFFGQQSGDGKDASSDGYLGQAQWQFNKTRNFNDWDNHRDSVFDTELTYGRNDLMMFGEHLGEPPAFSGYIDAGMRLVDSQLHARDFPMSTPTGITSPRPSARVVVRSRVTPTSTSWGSGGTTAFPTWSTSTSTSLADGSTPSGAMRMSAPTSVWTNARTGECPMRTARSSSLSCATTTRRESTARSERASGPATTCGNTRPAAATSTTKCRGIRRSR